MNSNQPYKVVSEEYPDAANYNTTPSSPPQYPRMMTIREIAATGVFPEHALRILVKEGKLPAVKCGTTYRINFDALLKMLEDTDSVLYI